MSRYLKLIVMFMVFLGSGGVCIAGEDVFTCALNRAYDCSSGDGCRELSIGDMALPKFVNIDLKSKLITSLDKTVSRQSLIASVDRLEDMVVIHGTELRGWSIALGEESGNLTLSASGDGEGFIVFGACMN